MKKITILVVMFVILLSSGVFALDPIIKDCYIDKTSVAYGETVTWTVDWDGVGQLQILIDDDSSFTNCAWDQHDGCLAAKQVQGIWSDGKYSGTIDMGATEDFTWYCRICNDDNVCDDTIEIGLEDQSPADDVSLVGGTIDYITRPDDGSWASKAYLWCPGDINCDTRLYYSYSKPTVGGIPIDAMWEVKTGLGEQYSYRIWDTWDLDRDCLKLDPVELRVGGYVDFLECNTNLGATEEIEFECKNTTDDWVSLYTGTSGRCDYVIFDAQIWWELGEKFSGDVQVAEQPLTLISCGANKPGFKEGETIRWTANWASEKPDSRVLVDESSSFTGCSYDDQTGCLAYSNITSDNSATFESIAATSESWFCKIAYKETQTNPDEFGWIESEIYDIDDETKAIDNLWNTEAQFSQLMGTDNAYLLFNYTKDSGVDVAVWDTRISGMNGTGSYNRRSQDALPIACVGEDKLRLRAGGSSNTLMLQCYDGSSWDTIHEMEYIDFGFFHEERINWQFSSNVKSASFNVIQVDCEDDSYCDPGYVCTDLFKCVKATDCTSNNDCNGYFCVDGTCEECEIAGDCAEGFLCMNNTCTSQSCDTHDNCTAGFICHNSICEEEVTCLNVLDCPSLDYYCSNDDICLPLEITFCSSNDQCSYDEFCSPDGICEREADITSTAINKIKLAEDAIRDAVILDLNVATAEAYLQLALDDFDTQDYQGAIDNAISARIHANNALPADGGEMSQEQVNAKIAIETAQATIDEKNPNDVNVVKALLTLNQAQIAYNSGDYALAKEKADEALETAQNARYLGEDSEELDLMPLIVMVFVGLFAVAIVYTIVSKYIHVPSLKSEPEAEESEEEES